MHVVVRISKHFLNEIESFCPIYSVIRKKSFLKKLSPSINGKIVQPDKKQNKNT